MKVSSTEQRISLKKSKDFFPGYLAYYSKHSPEYVFSPEECQSIIDMHKSVEPTAAGIGVEGKRNTNTKIRSTTLYPIYPNEESEWLYRRVIDIVNHANDTHFGYDVSHIVSPLSLLCYDSAADEPGHYDWHSDAGGNSHITRKISFSAQLSDPSTYTECDLIVVDAGQNVAPREQGSVSLFPSFAMHRVNPIETGKRWSLVTWVHGEVQFK